MPPPPDLPAREVARRVFAALALLSFAVCLICAARWDRWFIAGGPGAYDPDPAAKSYPVELLYLFVELIHDNGSPGRPVVHWTAVVPPWWQVGVFAVLPVIWTAGWLLRRPRIWRGRARADAGCCPACGYDLRATPVGRPCPECGIVKAQLVKESGN
jgi:hypothetical protein